MNQYTARTNHGFLLVEGTSTNATVKVYETDATEETATRLSAGDAQAGKNNYYFRDWDPDTTSTASDYPEINIKEGTTVSAMKNAWIPTVSETPITYDSNGNLDAAYEYDPFGKLIRHAGTRKDSMSLLYGTKYQDMETGLIYYGYRYYDPRQGRFINRDPIGEEGGLNLYGFVGNSPVNRVDFLGLNWPNECDPDHDDYDDDACDLILQSILANVDLDKFEVIANSVRTLNNFGPIGVEFVADYFDEYDDYAFEADNSGDGTFGEGGDPGEEKQSNEKKPCLDENGEPVQLTFDGRTLSGSDFSFPAASGVPTSQATSIDRNWGIGYVDTIVTTESTFSYEGSRQVIVNVGPIPEGSYRFFRSEERNLWTSPYSHGLRRSSWGSYSWSLYPNTGTNTLGRSGFFIHGGSSWGSAGCIDLTCHDKNFQQALQQYRDKDGSPDCYIQVGVSYSVLGNTMRGSSSDSNMLGP